ncbi:hypothetical protein MIND_00307100 [Mycena indigotica]|uniref:Uncharacterized protein n=1 Tax=Mycena indigotica TaxID=2126181 RepID=A0A8H6T1U8_9AGAR|nr:uncharacterized protein MIND_00307100 [Mycena indigotica]KAF7309364.1 hypothetical protein MIND_00307100 [Mycena indigotica]
MPARRSRRFEMARAFQTLSAEELASIDEDIDKAKLYDLDKHCSQVLELDALKDTNYAGRDEMRRILEENIQEDVNTEWMLQMDLILKLVFSCGYRPGALGLSGDRSVKWEDIQISCSNSLNFRTVITNSTLQDRPNIPHNRLVLRLESPNRPENVVFDIAIPLLCLALLRNGIKNIKTLDQLIACNSGNIEWESKFVHQAVLFAGGDQGCIQDEVMTAQDVEDVLRVAGRRVGFEDFSTYLLRRNLDQSAFPLGMISVGEARNLISRSNGTFRVGAQPEHLKRRNRIAPYSVPLSKTGFSDEECREHPDWITFTQQPEYRLREQKLAELKAIVDEGLAKCRWNSTAAIITRFERELRNEPHYTTAIKNYRKQHELHTSLIRSKLSTIRELLRQTANDKQLQEPSVPLEIVATPPVASGSNLKDQDEDVAVENLIDMNWEEINERVGSGEENIVEIRAALMKKLFQCGVRRCNKCQCDPTTSEADKTKVYTYDDVEQHENQQDFHHPKNQCLRWFHTHKTCFLCTRDGETVGLGSASSHRRHLRDVHSEDSRLGHAPAINLIPVSFPDWYLTPEEYAAKEKAWAAWVNSIPFPEGYIQTEEEMWERLKDIRVPKVDISGMDISQYIDVRKVNEAYKKRVRLSKAEFQWVYDGPSYEYEH